MVATKLRVIAWTQRTRAELAKIAGAKRRASAKTLGARAGRVLERSKMGKFVRWDVIDERLSWSFDQDKRSLPWLGRYTRLFGAFCYVTPSKSEDKKLQNTETRKKLRKMG